jgi:hypothetical protein
VGQNVSSETYSVALPKGVTVPNSFSVRDKVTTINASPIVGLMLMFAPLVTTKEFQLERVAQ